MDYCCPRKHLAGVWFPSPCDATFNAHCDNNLYDTSTAANDLHSLDLYNLDNLFPRSYDDRTVWDW